MRITFLGAAENVTGSRFFLQTAQSRILVDCGMFQERDLSYRNWERFPIDPSTIDVVLLTHAHIDHCGYLPKFFREGFTGKIICTRPTAEITKISLLDSAKVQEADTSFKRKRHKKEGRTPAFPEQTLYTLEDAANVFPHFQTILYEKSIDVGSDVKATFYDAGHILGSAMIELKVRDEGREKILVFSGDIGRWGRPILRDPHVFQKADYVFMEATYGDRLHESEDNALQKFADMINTTCEAGGNIIVPAFAIGRSQELLYDLKKLLIGKRICPLMIFVDSPLAMSVTEIFNSFPDYFDAEAQALLNDNELFFDLPLLKFTKSVEESKAINRIKGTALILAGSGMCTGGRIKHHLANNIGRPESTILFVSYQAGGTLGRQILERPSRVRILGQSHDVRARIEKINGFSAHADQEELSRWAGSFKTGPKKFFIIHAEKKAAESFAAFLKTKLSADVIIPAYAQQEDL